MNLDEKHTEQLSIIHQQWSELMASYMDRLGIPDQFSMRELIFDGRLPKEARHLNLLCETVGVSKAYYANMTGSLNETGVTTLTSALDLHGPEILNWITQLSKTMFIKLE